MNRIVAIENRSKASCEKKVIRNHHDFKFLPAEEVSSFMAYFPKIVEDATHKDNIVTFPFVSGRLRRLLYYYGTTGKHLRQHILIYVYKMIEKHFGTFDQKNLDQVYQLSWCLEMPNCQYMVLDDILDNHDVRRGLTAWHKLENIGMSSILDACILESSMFHLLKKYFASHPNYTCIVDSFTKLDLVSGMLLEMEPIKFSDFTLERLQETSNLKTSYYAMTQPFYLATLLANKGLYMNEMLRNVFDLFGVLCSIQNDMLDCYGEEFTGKPGTDIQENKCTAPIVLALRKASPRQKQILEECYGVNDDAKVLRVKEIYEELDVIGEYYKLERDFHHKIAEEIAKLPDEFTRSIIENLAFVYTFGEIGTPFEC